MRGRACAAGAGRDSHPYRALASAFFALCFIASAHAQWAIPDAPFRATVRVKDQPGIPDCGYLIDLPELGQTMPGLADIILTDAKGQPMPLAKVFRGEGGRALLLAQTLPAGQDVFVYFGGNRPRRQLDWKPKISVLLETRRLPAGSKLDDWPGLEAAWKAAKDVDGASFVPSIAHGDNPFGDSVNFISHYTGWLKTNDKKTTIYTQSCDASFVLVSEKLAFGWPGRHGPGANLNTVPKKEINTLPGATRIDYYHAKADGEQPPTMMLGKPVSDKMGGAIPAEDWLHPGRAEISKIEHAQGWPAPQIDAQFRSYLGWNGLWLYELVATLTPEPPAGWTAQWEWSDGSVTTGAKSERIAPGPAPLIATVRLTNDKNELRFVHRVTFGGAPPPEAQTGDNAAMARYTGLLEREDPTKLAPGTLKAGFVFLSEFGSDQAIGKWATAWMIKNPSSDDPLWIKGQLGRLRALAQTDPPQALAEMHKFDTATRRKYPRELGLMELEIMVFHLKDPKAVEVANRISFENANNDAGRLAKVRIGDLYRLLGRSKDAVETYKSVQKTIADETAGRKNAAQDRSNSITIADLLDQGYRHEALAKLEEWELEHPMAKYDSDFLLLRGRVLMTFGRWNEALQEIESFRAMQPDSPYQIPADFHRAHALYELGKKDEAHAIWQEIVTKYPKNELVPECQQWLDRK